LDLSRGNIIGGTVYDALIVGAAIKSGADAIVTFNQKHLQQLIGQHPIQLIVP